MTGFGIGSKQTVPTLNLDTAAEVLPADGVYITRTTDLNDGREWQSITNIGLRPTFDGIEADDRNVSALALRWRHTKSHSPGILEARPG